MSPDQLDKYEKNTKIQIKALLYCSTTIWVNDERTMDRLYNDFNNDDFTRTLEGS